MQELPPLERAGKWLSFLHDSKLSPWLLLSVLQLGTADLAPMAKRAGFSFLALRYLKNTFTFPCFEAHDPTWISRLLH